MDAALKKKLLTLSPEKRAALIKELMQAQQKKSDDLPNGELSHAEKRMYFLSHLLPNPEAYNTCFTLEVEGGIAKEKLQTALMKLLRKHPLLKSNYRLVGQRIERVIEPHTLLYIKEYQLATHENKLEAVTSKEHIHTVFDLEKDPLFRTILFQYPDRTVLLFVFHHIIIDGWSVGVFLKDLEQAINEPEVDASKPAIHYEEFVKWERKKLESLSFDSISWTQTLDNLPKQRHLHGRPSHTVTGKAKQLTRPLSINKSQQIKKYCVEHNISPFVFFISVYQLLIHHYTKSEHVPVGVAFANRMDHHFEKTIGFFVNSMPLLSKVDGALKDYQYFEAVKEQVFDLLETQYFPFDKLVESLSIERELEKNPLFNYFFVYQNEEIPEVQILGTPAKLSHVYPETSPFELNMEVSDFSQKESIDICVHYQTEVYSEAFIERWMSDYLSLVESIISTNATEIQELLARVPLPSFEGITVEEELELSLSDTNCCVYDLFAKQVRETPHSTAVRCEEKTLTYKELDEKSTALSHYLLDKGIAESRRVGIHVDRSVEMVIGVLAVLKTGASYVPLDKGIPEARIRHISEDAKLELILTETEIEEGGSYTSSRDQNLSVQQSPNSLMYIIYTSGSTGEPKGVMIEHRGFVSMILQQISLFKIKEGDSVLQFASMSFDACGSELFMGLLSGATVTIQKDSRRGLSECESFLNNNQVDIATFPPSVLRSLDKKVLQQIRVILTAGEAAHSRDVIAIAKHSECYNMYGPTEATVWTHYYRVTGEESPNESIPIGKPIQHSRSYILNEKGSPVADGEIGELYLSGIGLSRGYVSHNNLNVDSFSENPFQTEAEKKQGVYARLYKTGDKCRRLPSGDIVYIGRLDDQVKIRGFRVELGEVESRLCQCEGIIEAAVVVVGEGMSTKLVAYYKSANKQVLSVDYIKERLRRQLPEYMIPLNYQHLAAMPLTKSGKIDRRTLESRSREEEKYAHSEPKSDTEKKLVAIWSQLLPKKTFNIKSDFFDCGGHSLLLIDLLVAVNNTFNGDYSIKDLYQHLTIESLAKKIDNCSSEVLLDTQSLELSLKIETDIASLKQYSVIPNAIFITGATGFLGAHIINELLNESNAILYCLVRSQTEEAGLEKIKANISQYCLTQSVDESRIVPVCGDLASPQLGVSDTEYQILLESVDYIFHLGSLVNHQMPYSQLEKANVVATKEIISLATTRVLKKIIYASTATVFHSKTAQSKTEFDSIKDERHLLSAGYASSKWASERLFHEAKAQSVPVSVFRLGLITGDQQFAVMPKSQWFYLLMATCIQLKAYFKELETSITPASFVREAMIKVGFEVDSDHYVYHLTSPKQSSIASIFNTQHDMKEVSIQQWMQLCRESLKMGHELPIRPFILGELDKDGDALAKSVEAINTNLVQLDVSWTLEQLKERHGLEFPDLGPYFESYNRFVKVELDKEKSQQTA